MDGRRRQLGGAHRTGPDEAPDDHRHRSAEALLLTDEFEARYTEGILDELPPESERRSALAAPTAAPGEPFALRGCILTPKRKHDDGYVVVNGATIASVGTQKPTGVKVVETDGVILPGLIDLHGHPEYNVFSAWEPPKLYTNRYRWRDSEEYKLVVREPWKKLTEDPSLLRDLTRYAEARALVGGATAIQGASAKYPGKEEALVRNVDLRIFGQHKARSMIDLGRTTPDDRTKMRAKIDAGEVTALYVHLAEGIDERSRKEFKELTDANLLTKATVIIHGTALTDDQLGDVKDAGARLIWSPQSNLRLYGETTAAARAFELGIPVGLGADWLPSGSQSLLAELSVARRELQRQKVGLTPAKLNRTLIQAVTSDGAQIAGVDEIGEVAAGKAADLLVLERHLEDPWENVVTASPSWVQLVTIGGDLAYGRTEWMSELLDDTSQLESLVAWGNRMLLDTSYAAAGTDAPPPRLKEVRERLLKRYAQTGPIFA